MEDKLCGVCGSSMLDTASSVTAGGQLYHKECFRCFKCAKPVVNQFIRKGEHVYCKACYDTSIAKTCYGCNRIIEGQFTAAFGNYFHPPCFICIFCKRPIGAGNFHFKDGKVACPACVGHLKSMEVQASRAGDVSSVVDPALFQKLKEQTEGIGKL